MTQTTSTQKDTATAIEGFDRFSNLPYHSPSPGRIPMIAYLPHNPPAPLDEEMCLRMKECGINSAITSVGIDKIKESMQRAYSHGISTIVLHAHLLPDEQSLNDEKRMEERLSWCKELSNYLKDEPGLGGYLQVRTPASNLLPYLNPFVRKIEETVCGPKGNGYSSFQTPLVTTMLGERPPLGEGESLEEQIIVPKFERCDDDRSEHYLPRVQHCLGPGVWFSDSPAWQINSSGVNKARYQEYFNNLRIMELMSISTNRPFWSTLKCVTAAFRNNVSGEEPGPDGAMLFGAMSALAYGAQGLVFTNFRQVLKGNTATGSTVLKDILMPTWDYVKPVVDRIRQLEGVFLGAEVIDTVHTGDIPMGPVCDGKTPTKEIQKYLYTKMENPVGPLMNIAAVSTEDAPKTDKGFLVSHLALMPEHSKLRSSDHSGETLDFLVIVNQDIANRQSVKLMLSAFYDVTKVESAKIQDTAVRSRNKLVETKLSTEYDRWHTFTLEPGDALVLRWK